MLSKYSEIDELTFVLKLFKKLDVLWVQVVSLIPLTFPYPASLISIITDYCAVAKRTLKKY